MGHTTDQEIFWREQFGNEYSERNRGEHWIASNRSFFGRVLGGTHAVKSVLELGSNIGLNLIALKSLLPESKLTAVEINKRAAEELQQTLPETTVHVQSILDFQPDETWDLVFTKGVMIHLNPDKLPSVYELMYKCSSRYVLVAEYYNPRPVEIEYRGHSGKLFKRDFAGEMLDMFPDLQLLDYGFAYHRDPNFPQDDLTWFLMEKRG